MIVEKTLNKIKTANHGEQPENKRSYPKKLHRQKKMSLFNILNYLLLTIAAFVTIFPFLNIIATSFSSSRAILGQEVMMWPVDFNIDAYINIIKDGTIFQALKNTIVITIGGTLLSMIFTIAIAYPLSRERLRGRGIFLKLIVFTMMFNGGLIPTFLLIKNMNLVDNYLGLWLVGLVSTYNFFVMKTFFEGIPVSLEESAIIDGASNLTILLRIILPLSKPMLATLILFYAVGNWNSYFNVMIYITTPGKQSVMVKLMQMVKNADPSLLAIEGASSQMNITPEGMRAAAIVVSTLPIMVIYPFVQKYFVQGVMLGAVKG